MGLQRWCNGVMAIQIIFVTPVLKNSDYVQKLIKKAKKRRKLCNGHREPKVVQLGHSVNVALAFNKEKRNICANSLDSNGALQIVSVNCIFAKYT